MNKIIFLILLVTGFCSTTATESYILFKDPRPWYDAYFYCLDFYITLIQRDDIFSSEWLNSEYSKAWIGLITETTSWHDQDGKKPSYFNWSNGQPDNLLNELCVAMTDVGDWYDRNCTDLKHSVCFNGNNFSIEAKMNWSNAVINCKTKNSTLVQIPDATTNAEIRNMLSNVKEVWIDLRREFFWSWSDTGLAFNSTNWEAGQVPNLTHVELCAAIGFQNGTLTQESCDALYPFICTRISEDPPLSQTSGSSGSPVKKTKKTVIKLKMQTTANLEDPTIHADLKLQLHAMLANKGVTDFKLTWKKVPVSNKTGNP